MIRNIISATIGTAIVLVLMYVLTQIVPTAITINNYILVAVVLFGIMFVLSIFGWLTATARMGA